MGQRLRHGIGRRAVRVLAGGLAVGGLVAGVGVAGAAQQAAGPTITTTESGPAFTPSTATAKTGDTVTWNFPAVGIHNAESSNEVPADPAWAGFVTSAPPSRGTYTYTFTQPGTYEYLCIVHPNMKGAITVTGAPTEPTPTPTATPTPPPSGTPVPTPVPTATPGPSGGTPPPPGQGPTPAPAGGARETEAPAISGVRLKGVRHGARIRLRLSETATVTLRFKRRGSGKVVRTARVQLHAGTRTLIVRGDRLRRGRYTVELVARDGAGNTAPAVRAALRIARGRG